MAETGHSVQWEQAAVIKTGIYHQTEGPGGIENYDPGPKTHAGKNLVLTVLFMLSHSISFPLCCLLSYLLPVLLVLYFRLSFLSNYTFKYLCHILIF